MAKEIGSSRAFVQTIINDSANIVDVIRDAYEVSTCVNTNEWKYFNSMAKGVCGGGGGGGGGGGAQHPPRVHVAQDSSIS